MRAATLDEIRQMAQQATGKIDRLFIHWSAGHYSQFFSDYHINVDYDGTYHVSTDDLTEIKAHTWHQNTRAIGIAMACAYNATSEDLGPEPPTDLQIQASVDLVHALCQELNIPVDYEHVRTHAEQADEDGYGPATDCQRWDLAILRNGDVWMGGGDQIRKAAQ